MILVVISVLLGALSLVAAVPKILPVIGLALGINAVLKENKKTKKRKSIFMASIIGIASNGFVTLMFILKAFLI
jgi:hypothetical protein